MKVLTLSCGDWECTYVDGKAMDQDHRHTLKYWLENAKFPVTITSYEERCASEATETLVLNEGHFPSDLSDLGPNP